mgnify:CR=1 FL=1
MIPIIFCTLIYLFFIVNDLIPVYKEEKRNVFWLYISLFAFAYIMHLLILIDVKLPSPAEPIRKAVTSLFGLNTMSQ